MLLPKTKKDPVQSFIVAIVIGIHLLFMAFAFFSSSLQSKKRHHPIFVRTVTPKSSVISEKKTVAARPSAPAVKPKPAAPQPKPSAPAPKPVAAQPVPTPKQPPKQMARTQPVALPKPTPKEKKITTPPQPAQPHIPDKLLQELEETIAKIEDKSDKSRVASRKTVKSSGFAPIKLQIDAVETLSIDDDREETGEYTSLLTSHLHQSLHLPDFGEVKIELTLKKDGSVLTLKVLKTESEKNRQYLESHLPRLRFPPLEGSFAKQKQCTFVLTFCNEL